MSDSEAVFGIHEKTNRITIKIVDKKTKEVIREFPPEETLDMIAKAWELAGNFGRRKKIGEDDMAIRISGLTSGLDTDSIVQELVSAYSTKKENIEKKQNKAFLDTGCVEGNEYKNLRFYSKSLTEFKFMTSFNGMKRRHCQILPRQQ